MYGSTGVKSLNSNIIDDLKELSKVFEGDIYIDKTTSRLYATDASTYRQLPNAVTRPKNINDIRQLVSFAKKHNSSLISRGAGTSLAGQVVGGGIVVDMSKYFTQIIEVNVKERWVRVQPGVVRDELNNFLEPLGLFFSPETSTSDRCVIGGMVGNNACGMHSLIYGSTRDHVISVQTILSDSNIVGFGPLSKSEFEDKCQLLNLEGEIYSNIHSILSKPENQDRIKKEYPDPKIKRRNTGYAVDILLNSQPFSDSSEKFNFSKLLAGSEGTLAIITEVKLSLDPMPPPVKGLACIHCSSLEDSLAANLIALKYDPGAVELMDGVVMDLSKKNISQSKNRFFIKGDPEAMLMVEFAKNSKKEIIEVTNAMEQEMRLAGYGYHFPVVFGSDIAKVWSVRKAGLGLLSNMPGDAKPVPVIEDTAVKPEDLPAFITEMKSIFQKLNLECVYYAHIATGELHMRPVLNLKDEQDVERFHNIAFETAKLVKKYNGSLSGEHGDGRLRGEFIPIIIGEKNYDLLKKIKVTWDPENIFNAGKIINTPKMNTNLRYYPGQETREFETFFDFSESQGFLRAVEKCNGSGDCRRSEMFGGTMCPSFQATRNESASTRARANLLRELISESKKQNPFDSFELYDILDLCLSCKGCMSECPSNVDMAKLKAEFMQHYYDCNKVPLRARLIANIHQINRFGSKVPTFTNFILSDEMFSGILKKLIGFAPERNFPPLSKKPLSKYVNGVIGNSAPKAASVYFFIDEFTEYNDVSIGVKAIKLLHKLGYEVLFPEQTISGRSLISKGFLRRAKKLAIRNVSKYKEIISKETPLIGIEPSAIYSFRDEYPDLVGKDLKEDARKLGENCLMFDEFVAREFEKGKISKALFKQDTKSIKLHGHCQQKAIASTGPTKVMLSIPENYKVEEIKSGCCGMAGSFGYEKEHYQLSIEIGELVLFPEIRKTEETVIISAPGTSCRQQIKDGTERQAKHPVEILYEALK